MRVNLLRAHGTSYRYTHGACRCPLCKAASAERHRRYYAAHLEAIAERHRVYRQSHREQAAANSRAWLAAHPGKTAEYTRRYAERHPDRCAESRRKYREAHPDEGRRYYKAHREKMAAIRDQWNKDNPERLAERTRRWRRANPGKLAAYRRARLAAERGASGRHADTDVRDQYARQRGKCFWCEVKVGDSYHVDHVIPLALGGSNGPENLVIACPDCNRRKNAKHPMDFAGVLL